MNKRKTMKLPCHGLNVQADIQRNTFNEEDRTIEVVFSTGAKGKRGFFVEYFEELSMKKSDVRLERLNKGAPVLNNHSRSRGLEGILGVVEKAWIREKQGIALIRFSEREEVQGIIRDIQSGVIRNVSVGYKVHTYKDVSKKNDEIPTLKAVDWEPMEISFVDIPFDMYSQSRSMENIETYECTIERAEETDMNIQQKIREACKNAGLSDEVAEDMISREISLDEIDGEIKKALESQERNQTEETEAPEATTEDETETRTQDEETETEAPEVNLDEERKVAAEAERTRINEIHVVARQLDIDSKIVDEHTRGNTSVEDFRKIAIEVKAKKDQTVRTNNHNVEVTDMEQRELRMKGVENALLNRFKGKKYELTNEGNEFRYDNLSDLATRFLEAEGVDVKRMSRSQIATRALHSSSDFKEILANTANKSLRDAYGEAPQTFGPLVSETLRDDFKEGSSVQLHSGAALKEVKEGQEYEHTTLSESAEKYSLGTYGKIIGITRKTIINDDLGAFTRVPSMMGMKARSLESKLVWALITSNPTMGDGNALFSAAHGNLASGGDVADISVASVNKGMAAMMLQTDLDGELLDIMPSYLVGPASKSADIKSFLGATVPTQDSEVNPFKGDLDPIIERRLDADSVNAWYLMASAMMIDMIEIARLRGEEGPVVEQKEGFETDGLKLKVRYDFACKVLDWRGFYKNPFAG